MNCGPWSNFLILFTQPAAIICFLLLAVFPAVFHTIRLTLCFCKTEEIDNLFVSCSAKFWFVSVQIPRWCKLPSARGSQHQQPSDRSSSPTGLITLGRLFKGKLLLSTSYPSSWGSPTRSYHPAILFPPTICHSLMLT